MENRLRYGLSWGLHGGIFVFQTNFYTLGALKTPINMAKKKHSKPRNKKIVVPAKVTKLQNDLIIRGNQISKNNKANTGLTKYNKLDLDKIYKLALLGLNNQELAEFLDIQYTDFMEWIKPKSAEFRPELRETLSEAREGADAVIADRLYQRAKGYEHKETKFFMRPTDGAIVSVETIRHYPPDTQAAQYILNNKRSSTWKSRQTVDGNGPEGAIPVSHTVHVLTDPEKISKLLKDKQDRENQKKKGSITTEEGE